MSKLIIPTGYSGVELSHAIDVAPAIDLSGFSDPFKALAEVTGDYGLRMETAASADERKQRYDWLPFAAEAYGISSDLSNYVLTPVIIMNADLPNRNLVAFPFEQLSNFNMTTGSLNYQTFLHMPVHLNHVNQRPELAKGVVLDVGLRKVPNVEGDLWKVATLCAVDRSRDARTASKIMDGSLNSWSMGAYVKGYTCSICGSTTDKPSAPKCSHIPPNRKTLNVFRRNGLEELAYWKCGPFKGFEVSALDNQIGAFPTTDGVDKGFVLGTKA